MTDSRRLMLIDGHALIHRAFHALPEDLSTSSGEHTNAVFGFASMVIKSLDMVHPTHVIMTMDRPVPTFRHLQYADYKGTRPRTPQLLVTQFGRVREVADAMNIPIYELDGFEADDLLGTLSLQSDTEGIDTTIVTGDLDTLQLVSDRVHVLTARRGISDTVLYDLDAVLERYGLRPDQLPDYKGLVGDTSDNIPGVSGIGPKTATKLLAEHGSLENVYAHIEQITGKTRTALEAGKEQVFRSRDLATIVRSAPVTLDLTHCAAMDMNRSRVVTLFRELEFRTLIDRIQPIVASVDDVAAVSAHNEDGKVTAQLDFFGGRVSASSSDDLNAEKSYGTDRYAAQPLALIEAPPASTTHTRVVRQQSDLDDLIQEVSRAERVSIDTETTATDPLKARLVGMSFATAPETAWYVPVGHAEGDQVPLDDALSRLRPILEDPGCSKVGHNLKYDYTVFAQHGILVAGLDFDTMIAAYLANSGGRSLSLSSLAMSKFGIEMTPIETLIGKGKTQITMDLVDIDRCAAYAGDDAAVTLRLRDVLLRDLEEGGLITLFQTVEMPLVSVLAEMERSGVALNVQVLEEMSREMTEVIGSLEGRIYEIAGRRFNINSTQQLGHILFQELNLPSGRRTKTGFSTDNEVLEGLRGKHEIVDDILEYRQLLKLKNTYVDALPSLINPVTGRIHTDFNQTVAATGRLSSSNPNLQNIPIRSEIGRKIRRAFVPRRPDNLLLAADYSQIELRILASMSDDSRLTEAFLSGEDIHRATASAVFGVPLDEVTADQRRIAKVVNFGIIYGIGESRLAFETGITRAEAKDFIATYNATYSGVKKFMDNMKKRAAFEGFVVTMLGRKRFTPEIHSNNPGIRTAAERAAINMPIQGTAADVIKVAMIRLHKELSEQCPDSLMVLQVHDELVFDVPEDEIDAVAQLVRHAMEHALPLTVPLEVEMKVGRDWYDMKPVA